MIEALVITNILTLIGLILSIRYVRRTYKVWLNGWKYEQYAYKSYVSYLDYIGGYTETEERFKFVKGDLTAYSIRGALKLNNEPVKQSTPFKDYKQGQWGDLDYICTTDNLA